MNWGIEDFTAAALILSGLLGGLLALLRWRPRPASFLALSLACGSAAVSAWASLAVGVIGDGQSLVELVYLAFLPTLVLAALGWRLRPRAMGRLLLAFCLLQAGLCLFAALSAAPGGFNPAPVLVFNFILMGIWALAAWLFYLDVRRDRRAPAGI